MTELSWILARLDWVAVVDILLVALAVFLLLYLVRTTQAVPLLRGIIVLIAIIGLLTNVFPLRAFSWLLRQALPALLVAIPVIFQPELRRALERVGRVGALLNPATATKDAIEALIDVTVLACRSLASRRHGALIILERETGLQEYADTGVSLNADYSAELLLTIFDPHTPLHDGGVIVRGGRILAAACVLPLTTAFLADRRMGLRHRAGIGVTETTDAIAIIVSEERGSVSIAHNGRIIRRLDADRLGSVLRAFYQPSLRRAFPFGLTRFLRPKSQGSVSSETTTPHRSDQMPVQQVGQHSKGDAGASGTGGGAAEGLERDAYGNRASEPGSAEARTASGTEQMA
jgi:diadenylate cyclase